MKWRKVLLLAYPRSWRQEYGEELAGILARGRMTPAKVADVLRNAAKQHLSRDAPWKICGAVLFVFTLMRLLVWSDIPTILFAPVCIVIGAWTAMREKSGTIAAGRAAGKATLLCCLADVLTVLVRGPRMERYGGDAIWYRWGIFVGTGSPAHWWQYLGLLPIVVGMGVFLGWTGALMAKFFAGPHQRARA